MTFPNYNLDSHPKPNNTMPTKYKTEAERKQARRESKQRSRAKMKLLKSQQNLKVNRVEATIAPTASPIRITYVAIARDHSSSMSGIRESARQDYNNLIRTIKDNESPTNKSFVTTVECGVQEGAGWNGQCISRVANSTIPASAVQEASSYSTNGGSTPLWDAVGIAINNLIINTANQTGDISYLVQIVTDGEENSSRQWTALALRNEIQRLQATDKWTFTFRVPKGRAQQLANRLGIPAGNIYEWETTEKGMRESSVHTSAATKAFYGARAVGATSTLSFYADLKNVSSNEVKANCTDISAEVSIWPVAATEDSMQIRDFVTKRSGKHFTPGTAFYQLNKPEKCVQSYKKLAIRDKSSNAVYGGDAARLLLKLPTGVNIKLKPGDHGNYDLFVQSTSVNRKVQKNTQVLFWEGAAR